jgi:hypothetical protein
MRKVSFAHLRRYRASRMTERRCRHCCAEPSVQWQALVAIDRLQESKDEGSSSLTQVISVCWLAWNGEVVETGYAGHLRPSRFLGLPRPFSYFTIHRGASGELRSVVSWHLAFFQFLFDR